MKQSERPFEGILGNTIELRFLENLMANGYSRFNKKELCEVAGLARASTDKAIASFLQWGIIKVVEKHGPMTLYALDLDSPLVICMNRFNDAIILRMNPDLLDEIAAAEEAEASETLTEHDMVVSAKKGLKAKVMQPSVTQGRRRE